MTEQRRVLLLKKLSCMHGSACTILLSVQCVRHRWTGSWFPLVLVVFEMTLANLHCMRVCGCNGASLAQLFADLASSRHVSDVCYYAPRAFETPSDARLGCLRL